jgi:hypothetical protein
LAADVLAEFMDQRLVLKQAAVVLAMLSRESKSRPWINFEAGVGYGAGALVIPIVVRGLAKGEVGLPLGQLQIRDSHDGRDMEAMLADVEGLVNKCRTTVVRTVGSLI